MSAFLAVFTREWIERRALLAAALTMGFLPFLAPLLPAGMGMAGTEVRAVAAGMLALVVLVGASLYLGGSVLVSELEQKRLSFHFARPLRASDVWAGKLLAAWTLAMSLASLVLLPSALSGALPEGWTALARWFSGALLIALAAHLLASFVRLRSPWLAIDVLALPGVAFVLAAARQAQLLWEGTPGGYLPSDPRLAFALALAVLALATYTQVAWGRTDPRRSHGALSLSLWALAIPLSAGYLVFVSTGSPRELRYVVPQPAPAGDWVRIYGQMRGGRRSFLLDTVSRRYLRVAPGPDAFSADGRVAVWAERLPGPRDRYRLVSATLDEEARRRERDDLVFDGVSQIALSPSGRRLALVTGATISAYELESGKLLASAWGAIGGRTLTFPSEEVVRLLPGNRSAPPGGLELSLAERRLSSIPATPPPLPGWRERRLADGRLARLRIEDGRAVLELLAADGTPERSRNLGVAHLAAVLGEPATGELLVALNGAKKALPSSGRLLVLRLPSLETSRVLLGYGPIWSGRASATGLSLPSTRFFQDDQAALVRLDVHTGQRTRILAP